VSLDFERLNGDAAKAARATAEAVYRGAYFAAIESGDPFSSPDAFMGRFDNYASIPGFELVVAFEDGEPVGQAWGWPLGAVSRWWEGLDHEPEPGFTTEDGTRTFALSEIMVVREHAGHGVAHALHDELLAGRHEQRGTLLVRPANVRARSAYLRWGWQPVAKLTPHWPDAPTFDVLILQLPLR
jgi:GNAT superfamily N-acetyltransferase